MDIQKSAGVIDKQEAIKRLDALDAEAKALRAIIEAEPKKEPRGLCWVSDRNANPGPDDSVALVALKSASGLHFTRNQSHWVYATPLTEEEMRTYRGRWE